ncbi:MAG: hypothetical protein FJ225_11225 [Lentisphaerae bacterium]|nr:hypothetical protein [Lentisphaerota bacterium]
MTDHNCFRWPRGQQCAVSLTYDDALTVHHESVAPFLASRGLSATFNVVAHNGFTENTEAWKRVAALGHELGNHSLFHPCRRDPPESYPWLAPHYDLCHYTRQRWSDELRVANCLLEMIDGRSERTFGNTCCHTTIGQGEHETRFDDIVAALFVAARGPLNNAVVRPDTLRYSALGHFSGDARTAAELQRLVELARSQGGWIIFMFHGVGAGTHNLFIDGEQHGRFIEWLSAQAGQVWTASMVEVAGHLRRAGYAAAP